MNHLLAPAAPTFPVQDKFGNLQVSFGLSKIEYAAILIYANSRERNISFENAADDAMSIINAVQDKLIEMSRVSVITPKTDK